MLKQIQGGDKRKGGIRMWVDPKKVNANNKINGSKYSCKTGLITKERIKKNKIIREFFIFLSRKINIIIQETKKEK